MPRTEIEDGMGFSGLVGSRNAPEYTERDYMAQVKRADLWKQTAEAKDAEIAALREALNPRRWTQAQSMAWHRSIPDVQAAFDALVEATKQLPSQGTAPVQPEERCPKCSHDFALCRCYDGEGHMEWDGK